MFGLSLLSFFGKLNFRKIGWILALVAFVAVVGAAWWHGHKTATNECKAEKLAAVERAIEQAEKLREQDREILNEGFEVKRKIERVYIETEREIENADINDCDLGAGFVRLFNRPIQEGK